MLPVSVEDAFAYHDRKGALKRLIPPWESVRVEKSDNSLQVGSRVVLRQSLFGIPLRWVAEHTAYEPPTRFADRQVSGPFAQWEHEHRFEGLNEHCTLTDDIHYRAPGGPLGRIADGILIRKTIERMFAYRHRITRDDLELQSKYELSPQRIAISGASGLLGSSLTAMLSLLGHHVRPIVRGEAKDESEIAIWHDAKEVEKLNDIDVVIHLAGKPIAAERWSESVKQEIRDSRVIKTRSLAEAMASVPKPPAVLLCASGSGIYGDRGDEVLTEASELGDDFLADVARQWETACQPASAAGVRVVNTRFGIVMSPTDGALAKCLLPAKFMGGKLGSGKQWWPWIALDDVLGGLYHCMATPSIEGAVNFTSPQPLRNADFAKTLGAVLSRPAVFPAPAFALRLALGEMADDLLLSSTRAMPTKLSETGYRFRFETLEDALRYCLGCNRLESSVT
ncbi:MAG: TIGR01777 family oxidoreductase [Planctomycetota bacterium]